MGVSQEGIEMVNNYMESCPNPLVIKQMHIKTIIMNDYNKKIRQ